MVLGKSNIVDAIRWVLGEQSIKTLRGQKAKDIIFSGTQFRKSLGFAEVSITFDNSDQTLPISYDEVVITRKLYRDGESNYYINGAIAKLKTIQELFMDTGIGKDGYSIIGQGRIDEILSNNTEERRKVFDEATGIVKFRERKKEAVKNIEATENNLIRINDIIDEISNNLNTLEEQSQKATKYIEVKEKKKKIELRLFVENINLINEKNIILKEELKEIEKETSNYKKQIEAVEIKQQELSAESKQIEELVEQNYTSISEAISKISEIEKQIELKKEKIENLKKEVKNTENELLENNGIKVQKETEIDLKFAKLDKLKADKQKFELQLDEKENKLKEIKKLFNKDEENILKNKADIEKIKDEIYEIENTIYKKELEKSNLKENNKIYLKEQQNILVNIDKIRIGIAEEKSQFTKENRELIEKISSLENKKNNYAKKLSEIEELAKQVSELKNQKIIKANNLEMYINSEKDKNGFTTAIKTIYGEVEKNTEIGKKINGIVADLITVDKKYRLAVSIALRSIYSKCNSKR